MRYTTTLVLAVVVLVAAALMYVYRDQLTSEVKPPEKPSEKRRLVEGAGTDDVIAAKLEESADDGQAKTKALFKKADGKWRLAEPVDAPADEYEVNRLVRAAVEGEYRQSLEPGAAGQPTLETMGLAPPAFRLTLTLKAAGDKPERTVAVEVGRNAAFGSGIYARLADAKTAVMLENADLLARVRDRLDTYRSRDLTSVIREDVVRIELETEKGKVRLDKAEDDRWVLSQPLAARADADAVSGLFRGTLTASAKDFVADAAEDLVPFGLDKPRAVLTFYKAAPPPEKPKEEKPDETPEGEKKDEAKPQPKPEPVRAVTFRFGAWADLKKESVYVVVDDSKSVVTVAADAFNSASKGLADLRDKRVFALEPARATKVSLRVPAKLAESGAETVYDLVKADGQWKVHIEGRPDAKADADAVDALLKELADLKVIYFAEGEHAEVAKGFKPQGSVRVLMEKESAESGFEIGGPEGDVPALAKNLREDWIGRINDKALQHLRKDWLAVLDKQVLTFDPKEATRLAIRSAGRTVALEKTGEAWALVEPVKEETRAGFAADRLDDLKDLRATAFVAAAKDVKPWNLEEGELAVTVTLKPAKDGEKPVEKTLRLSHHEKAKVVGRLDGTDLVFEVPLALLKDLAAEPLPASVADISASGVKRVEASAGDAKVLVLKVDDQWFRADAAGRPDEQIPAADVDNVVRAVADLKALRWVSYDAKDPAAFGLDQPVARIHLEADKAKATVLLSAKDVPADIAALFDEQPLRYAMAEGGKRIAVISGKPVDTILGAAKTLSPRKPEPKKDEPAKDETKKDAEKAPETPAP